MATASVAALPSRLVCSRSGSRKSSEAAFLERPLRFRRGSRPSLLRHAAPQGPHPGPEPGQHRRRPEHPAAEQRGLPAGLLRLRRHGRQGHGRHRQQHLGGLRQERAPGLQRGQPQVHPHGLHGGPCRHHQGGQPAALYVRQGDGGLRHVESKGSSLGPVPGRTADPGGCILSDSWNLPPFLQTCFVYLWTLPLSKPCCWDCACVENENGGVKRIKRCS